MATATPHPSAVGTDKQEIVIVSHSTLFYWWPVWALGFVFFLLSYFGPTRMALVPPDTDAAREVVVEHEGRKVVRDALIAPEGQHLPTDPVTNKVIEPHVRMAPSKGYGVVFMVLLFFVVLITNVPLRGMWSLMVLVVLFLGTVILWLAGWWERILHSLSLLQIYVNAGGYLTIAVLLFGLWLVTFIFFDRQV